MVFSLSLLRSRLLLTFLIVVDVDDVVATAVAGKSIPASARTRRHSAIPESSGRLYYPARVSLYQIY